jgi:predicted phage terminase large subunit-like protein
MPDPDDPNTVHEDLCYYNMEGRWKAIKYKAHTDDFSKVLWAERKGADEYKALMADLSSKGKIDLYSQEYLNEPISATAAFFPKDRLLPITKEDREMAGAIYTGADLAISERDKRAYTVIYVAKYDIKGRLQFIDRRKARLDGMEIMEELFSIQMGYQPEEFFIEDENIRKSLGSILDHEMTKRGIFLNITPVVPSKDKRSRAKPLQAMVKAKAVLFDKESDWFPDAEKEFLRFPKGPYKDDVDAAGLIAANVGRLHDSPEEEDEYDEVYEEEYYGENYDTGY